MLKKIIIVLGIIIVWEQRDSIVPVAESVVSYVIAKYGTASPESITTSEPSVTVGDAAVPPV